MAGELEREGFSVTASGSRQDASSSTAGRALNRRGKLLKKSVASVFFSGSISGKTNLSVNEFLERKASSRTQPRIETMNKITVSISGEYPIVHSGLRFLLGTTDLTFAMMIFLWQIFLLTLAVLYMGIAVHVFWRLSPLRHRPGLIRSD